MLSTAARRLTDASGAGTLIETKGFIVSENQTPSPGDASPFTPPPAPPAPPALPAVPAPPAPQPAQNYPGAAPGYSAPGQPPYGVQPGYAPPSAAPAYGTPPVQPGYAPYAAPGYPAAAPRPTSGLAVTSLICGIAGLVLFWAFVPLLASIAAVITGHMALGQTKRDPRIAGRGMAIAGLIMGYAGVAIAAFMLISVIISVIFLGAFSVPYISAR